MGVPNKMSFVLADNHSRISNLGKKNMLENRKNEARHNIIKTIIQIYEKKKLGKILNYDNKLTKTSHIVNLQLS